MPRKTITIEVVKALQPGQTVWASSPTGFCCRCQRDAKVYGLKYRFGGRQRWLTIGKHGSPWTPATAKIEAERLLGLVADRIDPAERRDKDKTAQTMATLCERFIEDHAKAKRKDRTADEYRRLIDKIIIPILGKRLVKDVTRADVAKLHHQYRATPYQANRVLAVLSKLFNLAEVWGERQDGSNPCRHVEKFPEKKRERMLSAEELEGLGSALRNAELDYARAQELDLEITEARKAKDTERANVAKVERKALGDIASPSAVAAIRLLVFTGARLSEVLGLKWEWIDFVRGEARLPDSKTGAKTLHLPPPALVVLAELPHMDGNPYVITGQRAGEALVNLEKPWRNIRKAATICLWRTGAIADAVGPRPSFQECLEAAAKAGIKLPTGLANVRLHDLRHAFASVAASSGMALPIIGKILGHTQAQTTARYAHLAQDPVKAAAAAIAGKIEAAMGSRRPKVQGS